MSTVNTLPHNSATRQPAHFFRHVLPVVYVMVFAAIGWLAFLLRFDFTIGADWHPHLAAALVVWALVKLIVFRYEGMDRELSRTVSASDLSRILLVNAKASLLSGTVILFVAPGGFPRSVYLIDFVLCALTTVVLRMMVRLMHDHSISSGAAKKRALIYGAGDAGQILLQDIRTDPRVPYKAVGFVDDKPNKRNSVIQGLRVLGTGKDLGVLIHCHRVEEVLIAAPSATGAQMTEIFERCRAAGVPCKTVPALEEILSGSARAGQVRDVHMEDLLGRHPVQLDEETIRQSIEGRIVLVTGAGGSIGSELCRQIARFRPALIVGYEISENALYELNREMRELFPAVEFHPAIGSIQNATRLAEVMERYLPQTIYHAAAYKHVPMMEDHLFEAVENNVFGTLNVVQAAQDFGVEKFVLISSDKAVQPTNVMGATKRLAELICKSMQNGGPKYVAVRFGNVLGSNGSVIPLFKRQIAAGGPVTVTDPDMERYFMTISEAVQLVLQTAAIGEGGEIFVLEMGEPVKIVDLARNLILLSGFRPDADIAIKFTGVRPGEKLREELNSLTETTVPTRYEKIRIFNGPGLTRGEMEDHLKRLRTRTFTRNVEGLVEAISAAVPEYQPSEHVMTAIRLARVFGWPARGLRPKVMAAGAAG